MQIIRLNICIVRDFTHSVTIFIVVIIIWYSFRHTHTRIHTRIYVYVCVYMRKCIIVASEKFGISHTLPEIFNWSLIFNYPHTYIRTKILPLYIYIIHMHVCRQISNLAVNKWLSKKWQININKYINYNSKLFIQIRYEILFSVTAERWALSMRSIWRSLVILSRLVCWSSWMF